MSLVCKCGHTLLSSSNHLCHLAFTPKTKHMTLRPCHQIQFIPAVEDDANNGSTAQDFELDPYNSSNRELLKTMRLEKPEKKSSMIVKILLCKNCGAKVASVVRENLKPSLDDLFMVAFRPEQTFITPNETCSVLTKKWHERLALEPTMVEPMTLEAYVEELKRLKGEGLKEESLQVASQREKVPSVFFSSERAQSDLEYFLPPTLECSDVRGYQAEMYYQCLLGNAIISLPTGLGKTLVAILLMKKYHEMNEGKKLVGFVVNRIPLAFQQSSYFERETQIECPVLSQPTKDKRVIEQLKVSVLNDGNLIIFRIEM